MENAGEIALLSLLGFSVLDKEYSNIRFINCDGRLEGDRVILDKPIYAYTLAAFEVW